MAIPPGAIATESMSPRPRHGSEWRSRQPSACNGARACWTASLGAGPDSTPASEREPVARAHAERAGDDEQAHSDESRAHAGGP